MLWLYSYSFIPAFYEQPEKIVTWNMQKPGSMNNILLYLFILIDLFMPFFIVQILGVNV